MHRDYLVIKRPIISEKSTALAEVANKYVFEISKDATKVEVRDAVQRLFKVKVEGVRTLIVPGKTKRSGRFENKRMNWKKAIVTLSAGSKIDFFQNK
jgi:large subunit ribosomal protein L23